MPPLKYMIVTAYTTKRNSETPVRIHHHIIMNGGLDRDVVEDLWRKRRRKGQKKGDKIGFCNADRLQADENGISVTHYSRRFALEHNNLQSLFQT